MKIQLASDLHRKINSEFELPQIESDVIILAGDIASGTRGIEYAIGLHKEHGKPVIYIPGNHEFYGHEYHELLSQMKALAENYQDVHLLDNTACYYNDFRFLGTTLWTDFVGDGSASVQYNKDMVMKNLNDHRLIRFGDHVFTADDALSLHQSSRAWLKEQLASIYSGKTIVISHHAPSLACQHPDFLYSAISTGFLSNMDDLVSQADLWVFGHTHANLDIQIGSCRLVSNQLGYPRETMPYPFNEAQIIEL